MSFRHRGIVVACAAAITVLVAGCGGGLDAATAPTIPEPTFEFVIPAGSGDRLAKGEPLDILPAEMNTSVGDTIRIVNEDTVGHALGPWFVGPGETIRQRFVTAGTFSGFCSVHPDEAFTVHVAEA